MAMVEGDCFRPLRAPVAIDGRFFRGFLIQWPVVALIAAFRVSIA